MEFGDSSSGTMTALALLLGCSAREGGRGGGDPHVDAEQIIGSWAGDRIAIVGDYGEDGDLSADIEAEHGNAGVIYHLCDSDDPTDEEYSHAAVCAKAGIDMRPWTDVSELVLPLVTANSGMTFWRTSYGGVTRGDAANKPHHAGEVIAGPDGPGPGTNVGSDGAKLRPDLVI